jgi:F0F1-type ATP synthase membrane subunit b/b'
MTGTRSPFVPMLLLAGAVLILLVFQTTQLYRDRDSLRELKESQEKPLEEAQRLRQQLDGVAADTARLAEKGNANAKLVVEELRKRGITINPNAAADNPPKPE